MLLEKKELDKKIIAHARTLLSESDVEELQQLLIDSTSQEGITRMQFEQLRTKGKQHLFIPIVNVIGCKTSESLFQALFAQAENGREALQALDMQIRNIQRARLLSDHLRQQASQAFTHQRHIPQVFTHQVLRQRPVFNVP